MAKKPITPGSTPVKTLVREMMFSYIQNKVGVAKLTKMMKLAKEKGFIKTPKQFRYWLNDEVCKTVDVVDRWLSSL